MKKIYFAPSSQIHNVGEYATYRTNEGEVCNLICTHLLKELMTFNVVPVIPLRGTINTSLIQNETRANELGCSSYYAIHTNAGPATAKGVTAIKQTSPKLSTTQIKKSEKMAVNMCKAIEGLGRKNRGAYGKLESDGDEWYADMRVPKMPSALVEIDFHTNKEATEWLVNHKKTIGIALAHSVVKSEALYKKGVGLADLSVYKRPGLIYPTYETKIPVGERITLYKQTLNWFCIDVAGTKWVRKRYVRVV